jgi:hypothetical protein
VPRSYKTAAEEAAPQRRANRAAELFIYRPVEGFDSFLPGKLFVTLISKRVPRLRHLQELIALRRAGSIGHFPALGCVLAIF